MKKNTGRSLVLIVGMSILLFFLVFFIRYERKKIAFRSSPQYQFCESLKKAVKEKRWEEANELVFRGAQKKLFSTQARDFLHKQLEKTPFSEAYKATQAILQLKKTGLDFKTVFPIAFFKETHMLDALIEKGVLFLPEARFGRELQWDPETKSLFIHCGTHGVRRIGIGHQKVVTKTVLYDKEHPQVLARGLTERNIQHEVEAMKAFLHEDGIISGVAFLEHKDPISQKQMIAIVTPIYNHGSLQKVLNNKNLSFSFQERLTIAKDIISGLASLHTKGYVHRDLGARNHFVSIEYPSKGKRVIKCVIADLEKVSPARNLHGSSVQGNSSYLCPEGIFLKNMKGDMYFSSDIFAIGCVFWRLYFDKMPPWSTLKKAVYPLQDPKVVYTDYIAAIEKGRQEALTLCETIADPQKKQFLEIILQMTHPHPEKRGQAFEIKKRLLSL